MKGVQGLIVAAILGVLGIALNWIYLDQKTRDAEIMSFIGIKPDADVKVGDLFTESSFERVTVPRRYGETLKEYVFLFDDKNTIVNTRASRNYKGGQLLFREDYRTPPTELELAENEQLLFVPATGFVPSLLNPGDEISFIVPITSGTSGPVAVAETETIGPFRIKSLGNRIATSDAMKAAGQPISQEQTIGVIVRKEGAQVDANAMRLQSAMARNSGKITIKLHARPKQK